MRSWDLLASDCMVLDLGCGSGRLVEALAPHAGFVVGTDVSPRMLDAARQRCSEHRGVLLLCNSGRDLAALLDARFDVVCAIDVFPYLVLSGLAEAHIREAARVLRPGGHLLVVNYAYDLGLAAACVELARFASRAGFEVTNNGTSEFRLWDGVCFLLRKF
jgi:SAM-dependent methyltransferase